MDVRRLAPLRASPDPRSATLGPALGFRRSLRGQIDLIWRKVSGEPELRPDRASSATTRTGRAYCPSVPWVHFRQSWLIRLLNILHEAFTRYGT